MCCDPVSRALDEARPFVIDTNIVLDMFVFNDPLAQPLKAALVAQKIRWLATVPMRDELVRVLAYPKIAGRLASSRISADDVLTQVDQLARRVDAAPHAGVRCADPDDQKFIDLAVARKATLLSKDLAILCMKKRLLALDVQVDSTINLIAILALSDNIEPEKTGRLDQRNTPIPS